MGPRIKETAIFLWLLPLGVQPGSNQKKSMREREGKERDSRKIMQGSEKMKA